MLPQYDNDCIHLQETEISELNDMLTEAGDTFQHKEQEISKLQELIKEYETKMETQVRMDLLFIKSPFDHQTYGVLLELIL